MRHPYCCADCDGEGETTCHACDSEIECETCGGEGLDDDLMDVDAYINSRCAVSTGRAMWAWIVDGVMVGCRNDTTAIAYAAFDRDPAKREQAPKAPYSDPAQMSLFAKGGGHDG